MHRAVVEYDVERRSVDQARDTGGAAGSNYVARAVYIHLKSNSQTTSKQSEGWFLSLG